VSEPVNRGVPEAEAAAFRREAASLKRLPVSDADLSTLYRLGDGGLSPLTGPMDRAAFHKVLDDEVILANGRAYAWTIPLSFPMDKALAGSLKAGETVALTNGVNEVVGTLRISDIFPWDKAKYIKVVYGTERTDHPGGRMVTGDPRDLLLGGEVRVLPQPRHPEYGQFVLSPRQTRDLFRQKGWQRVVAFQTRNPLHRAHEYALVYGLEKLTRDGHFAGAVLNPLVGETKGDDVDAATRMRTYKALIDNKALGDGDSDEALWKKVGCAITDRIILLGLDIKMFYGGPKEAIMHAIMRKNFGCTHICIGRDHAGIGSYYGPYAAQEIFKEFPDLGITPFFFREFYYCKKCAGIASEKTCPHGEEDKLSFSGTKLRQMFSEGKVPPKEFMRPEVAQAILKFEHPFVE